MFPIRILQLSIKSTHTSCLVLSDPVNSVLVFLSVREIFTEKKKKNWSICLELNYWGEVLLSVPHAVELVKVRNEVNGDKIYPSEKVGCS